MFLCTLNPPPKCNNCSTKLSNVNCITHFCARLHFHISQNSIFFCWDSDDQEVKKVWCIRWKGKEGCNPMFIINCCWCQLLWRWIMYDLPLCWLEWMPIKFTCFD
jgi:hypothetical protein